MSKLKEYQIPLMCGGVQLHAITICHSKKEAANIFGTSKYYVTGWGFCRDPKTPEAMAEPFKIFAYYDSGWMREKKPEWFRKVLPYDTLKNYIYKENSKKYDKLINKK